MNFLKSILAAFLISCLVGCQPSANTSTETADPVASPVPAISADPNAINTEIAADAVKARFQLIGSPKAAADGKSMDITLEVSNEGTETLYGTGSMPVNIGIQILGQGDSIKNEGGVRDFMRAPLPLLPPGSTATVVVPVRADARLDGRKLRFTLVQEKVRWYDDLAPAIVEVGPFKYCDGRFCDITATPPTQ